MMTNSALIEKILADKQTNKQVRLQSKRVDGERYWIKRYDCEDRAGYKLLHRIFSKLPVPQWTKPSPSVDATAAVNREVRKTRKFADMGFKTADIIFYDENRVIFGHAGHALDDALRNLRKAADFDYHDALICNAAETLGQVHKNGLCHGRPHLRDMFIRDGEIGFLDFEEEPEQTMPLNFAQARDCWLFFIFAAGLVKLPSTGKKAFRKYHKNTPDNVMEALEKIHRFWHRFIQPFELLKAQGISSDLRRIIMADRILQDAFQNAEFQKDKMEN